MQQNQPQEPGFMQRCDQSMRTMMFASSVFTAPLHAMLRKDMGPRYMGVPALIALLLLPLWPGFFPGHDPRPMFWFWLVFVAACLCRRVAGLLKPNELNGDDEAPPLVHSYYSGWPRLSRLFPKWSEEKVKSTGEPLCIGLVGLVLLDGNEPLGSYLLWAAAAQCFSTNAILMRDKARLADMHDAYLEQTDTANRFRAMRGERF